MNKSTDFPDCFYRVTVKGLYVKDGKVLLLKESSNRSGKWELPGGGLEFGEDIKDTLEREIKEETGIKVTKIYDKPLYVWTWRYEKRRNMDWFYSLVLAYRIEVDSLEFTPTDECEKIGLFSKDELNDIELCQQVNVLKDVFDIKDFE